MIDVADWLDIVSIFHCKLQMLLKALNADFNAVAPGWR